MASANLHTFVASVIGVALIVVGVLVGIVAGRGGSARSGHRAH